jgi:tetratricopeptide (TPR) repeat protein
VIAVLARRFALAWICAALSQSVPPANPDELYAHRDDLPSASRAADLWAAASASDYGAAWKLARAGYFLGTHLPGSARRAALERGVKAGESAVGLAPGRPEGHFWLAANMGRLAESYGLMQGLRYRGRIRDELERVLAIDRGWQGGAADAALGQWYFEVPRLFGGSVDKAETHLRKALDYDPNNLVALVTLADLLESAGKREDARVLLRRVLDAPISPDWTMEDRDSKRDASERLARLSGK